MPYFGKLVDWVKLSPKQLATIFIFTGPLLLVPERGLVVFGIVGLPDVLRLVLLLAFVLSGAGLLVEAVGIAYGTVKRKWDAFKLLRARRRRLHRLSEPEKEVLRGYIEGGTRTQVLSMSEGIARGLEAERTLYQGSGLSQMGDHFAYNIRPWAWDYLNKNPDLLS